MNKTEHYQLNQWDPEDRILRTEFNADNAAIETALKENAETIAAEAAARANADSAIHGELAAAIQDAKNTAAAAMAAEQSARAGEDAAIRNELAGEANTRYAQDTAIRQEFAAADAYVAAQNCMVKLAEITTSATVAQVDVNVAGLNLTQYREVIIYPEFTFVSSSTNRVTVHLNNIASGYILGTNNAANYLAAVYPVAGADDKYSLTCKLMLHRLSCLSTFRKPVPLLRCPFSQKSKYLIWRSYTAMGLVCP